MVQIEILTVVDNVLRKVFQKVLRKVFHKVASCEAPFPWNLLQDLAN
jgi:hypothetical protein